MEKKLKAALYLRVSTFHQIDKDSLPLQESDLINYSKYVLGIDDFVIFKDAGYSGKDTDRPAYQNMMSRIRMGEFSHLLVWKIDRISRNLRDFSEMYDELKKYNVTFISKNEQFDTSTAMGEAMLKIILVFAELERKLTAERVFAVMMSRAEKGLWNGATVPLGFIWDEETKFPKIYEPEAKIVQYIFDLYEELHSTSKVAIRLNMEKIKTKRNGTWTARTVGAILTNPFYIGTYRYNTKTQKTRRWKDKEEWIVIEDHHKPIISKEQFEKVGEILKANYKGDYNRQRKSENVHILSSIIKCNKCHSNMRSGNDRSRNSGFTPSRYTCYLFHKTYTCSNYASDLAVLPFIINYIANYMTLQERITEKHSYRDMESILLRGKYFEDIEHLNKDDLKATYKLLVHNLPTVNYKMKENKNNTSANIADKYEIIKAEKTKQENALKRLDDLFLYDENALSQKDFLLKRNEITAKLDELNSQIQEVKAEENNYIDNKEFSLQAKASFYIITQLIGNSKNIDVRYLLENVDKSTIKDFISSIISEVSVDHKRIHYITFKNGLTHHFEYNDENN